MFAVGSMIAGRYRLVSLIGEGGMASVWRADDETLKRSVAIKLLYFRAARDPQAIVDQFLREARIAASLQHRNVIHIVDFGTTDDNIPYMVMELLHGESLADRMEREALAAEDVVRVASLTLRGLAAVHDAGIVHRDLKPQNIFLQSEGDATYPKILDFGISRSLGASSDRPSAIATQQGLVVGTPHYMAPEQARGEAEIDKRADIYAMGAIIFEGITGQLPFDAGTPGELLVKIISGRVPTMREVRADVPELLSDCVAQAMAHDRAHRFVDAKVFRRALQSAAEQAFPGRVGVRSSELPKSVVATAVGVPVRAASGAIAAATSIAQAAWGDFEGLKESQERPARAAARGSAAGAVAVAQKVSNPPPAPAAALAHVPAPAVLPVAAPPKPQRPANSQELGTSSHDNAMLGDNPLDVFGQEAPMQFDIDYDRGAPRSSRRSPLPRAERRSATGPGYQDKRPARQTARGLPSPLYALPALLFLLLCVLLIAPGLASAPVPDTAAAAAAREAQNPATRNSTRRLQGTRPTDLAKLPPALRELQL